MGCDIHCYAEVQDGGRWKPLYPSAPSRYDEGKEEYPTVFGDRNYDVFAILAGVRNDRGFAGVPTGTGFVPMSEPRGLPLDMCLEYQNGTEVGAAFDKCYLGDHSFSYFTLAELLSFDYTRTTTRYGVVSFAQYVEWMNWEGKRSRNNPPHSYCSRVLGQSIVVHENDDVFAAKMAELTRDEVHAILRKVENLAVGEKEYCHVSWEVDYAFTMERFASHVILPLLGEAKKRTIDHDDLRIVFGFDS